MMTLENEQLSLEETADQAVPSGEHRARWIGLRVLYFMLGFMVGALFMMLVFIGLTVVYGFAT